MERMSPRPRSPSLENSRDESSTGRTQCHEPCSSRSPYTMRPHHERQDYRHEIEDDDDLDEDPEIDPGQEDTPEMDKIEKPPPEPEIVPQHHPQLQIRRDLHPIKSSTVTSGALDANFLTNFRKRHFDGDGRSFAPHMKMRLMHPSHLGPPSHGLMAQSVPIPSNHKSGELLGLKMEPLASASVASDLSMKKDELPPPRPPQNPPKKTGFTIEDIMRR